jgi:hypothetical protein
MWVTEAYFPVPPVPKDGFRTIPHNKALAVSFQTGVSRPTYTRAALKMMMSFKDRGEARATNLGRHPDEFVITLGLRAVDGLDVGARLPLPGSLDGWATLCSLGEGEKAGLWIG